MFYDRRQKNRRQYSMAQEVLGGASRRLNERRNRNGLFSTSDRAWWLKVDYLDVDSDKNPSEPQKRTG